ncbi:hypothetical protein EUX98_g5135 [Antrodiella citrinella]|uniref:Protein CPL1-like domain-containing protein n=1 Tax=Antrodiella citrinella TaxID=2447956 RepID=A0A4S4N051_9APHY|nr:hypothetical protein EUX98_g5135 [Antrodiella citrinella]
MRSTLYTALSLLSLAIFAQASALPDASVVALSSSPSPALEARAPQPSNAKRSPHSKRKQTPLSPEEQMSRHLCPLGMNVCPIPLENLNTVPLIPTTLLKWIEEGFECVDLQEDLTSCGGCGSVNASHDCTTIPNALGVSCIAGVCHVDTCKSGFTLAADGKTCVRLQ